MRTDGLTRRYGGITAVDACSIDVQNGSITGLIGPNGSGKTTLFNLITGLAQPDAGQVYLAERRVTRLRPDQLCQRGPARTFQITRLFWNLSVVENMIVPLRQAGLRALLGRGMYRHEEQRALALLERLVGPYLQENLNFPQIRLPLQVTLTAAAAGVALALIAAWIPAVRLGRLEVREALGRET